MTFVALVLIAAMAVLLGSAYAIGRRSGYEAGYLDGGLYAYRDCQQQIDEWEQRLTTGRSA